MTDSSLTRYMVPGDPPQYSRVEGKVVIGGRVQLVHSESGDVLAEQAYVYTVEVQVITDRTGPIELKVFHDS